MVVAELIDGCQLKCALCPNRFREQSMNQMPLSIVENVLKKYPSRWIDWFNWGEPLLHKEFSSISKAVDHTPSRVSTNLSHQMTDEQFLALNRFRVVLVSLSGMTEDVYGIYHCGGSFGLVKHNLDRLIRSRRKKTIINWLSHKFNREQDSVCREFCEKQGLVFNLTPLVCTVQEQIGGFDNELLQEPKLKNTGRSGCRMLNWPTIGVDGSYLLCCASQNVKIGPTIEDDLSQEEMVSLKKKTGVCMTCHQYEFWRMYN